MLMIFIILTYHHYEYFFSMMIAVPEMSDMYTSGATIPTRQLPNRVSIRRTTQACVRVTCNAQPVNYELLMNDPSPQNNNIKQ